MSFHSSPVCAPLPSHVTRCRPRRCTLSARTRARAHAYSRPLYARWFARKPSICYLRRAIETFLFSPIMPRCPLHLAKRGEIIKRVECRRPRSVLSAHETEREGGGRMETGRPLRDICIVCTRIVATRRRVIESIDDLLPNRAAPSDD